MTYTLNKVQLNVLEQGSGSLTLVFLHYFGGSALEWQLVINQLSAHFHCLAVDLRGHGNSVVSDEVSPETSYSVDAMADDVDALLQTLGISNFVLIGHSMSGKVALALAAGSPDRRQHAGLRSLILVAPSPPLPEPIPEKDRQEMLSTHGQRSAAEQTFEKITVKPVSEETKEQIIRDNLRTTKAAWNAWLTMGSKEDITNRMSRISVPIAIIAGLSDIALASDVQPTMTIPYLKNVTFDTIPDAGHLLPLEVPDIVVDFIQKKIAGY